MIRNLRKASKVKIETIIKTTTTQKNGTHRKEGGNDHAFSEDT